MGPSDSYAGRRTVIYSHTPLVNFDHPRSPPRFLDRSFRACCPLTPREARGLHTLVASPPVAGFVIIGSLATLLNLTYEAETSSLALRPARSIHGASATILATARFPTC